MALFECEGDKAPGPDGFNFSFIKADWDIIKKYFCEMLLEFHSRGKLSKELNDTFFTLIPKVPNPLELREFRPISLVGYAYKLLAKILATD